MKAYLAIKYHADNRNRPIIKAISDTLQKHGCDSYCVARDLEHWGEKQFSAEDLMQRSFAAIEHCDFVLVELSEKGVGLGIEAGYAYAKGKPIVTLAQAGCDISTTLSGISAYIDRYDSATLEVELARALKLIRSQTLMNTSDKAQVQALDRAWNKAYQDRDLSALANILADDWLAFTPEHEVVSKAQLLEAQESASPSAKVSFKQGSVHLFGTLALTTGETKVEGDDVYIHQRFTRSYLKRDGAWRAVAVQIVPIPII